MTAVLKAKVKAQQWMHRQTYRADVSRDHWQCPPTHTYADRHRQTRTQTERLWDAVNECSTWPSVLGHYSERRRKTSKSRAESRSKRTDASWFDLFHSKLVRTVLYWHSGIAEFQGMSARFTGSVVYCHCAILIVHQWRTILLERRRRHHRCNVNNKYFTPTSTPLTPSDTRINTLWHDPHIDCSTIGLVAGFYHLCDTVKWSGSLTLWRVLCDTVKWSRSLTLSNISHATNMCCSHVIFSDICCFCSASLLMSSVQGVLNFCSTLWLAV